MADYPPPPPPDYEIINPPMTSHYSQQNDDHHQYRRNSNNRENLGWNDDNVLPGYNRPHSNNRSEKKYNRDDDTHCHSYNSNNKNYNNSGPPSYSQRRHDDYNHHYRGGSNTVKRAVKRRVKHDLPGPAGNWFRQTKQQKSAAIAAAANRKGSSSSSTASSGATKAEESGNTITNTDYDNKQQALNNNEDRKPTGVSSSSSPSSSNKNNNIQTNNPKQQQDEQLFHDHSSDLHECNAWNLMCTTLNRIVPPANLLLHYQSHHYHHYHLQPTTYYTTYKSILRKSIPINYALIHEIHEGKYDTCHLNDKHLYSTDLRVPLLVGYVASVQCHAHSDWTVLLVDELYSVVKYCNGGNSSGGGGSSSNCGNGNGGGNSSSSSSSSSGRNSSSSSRSSSSSSSNNAGRGILCWIEERLVKQHANWVRPGVVWMIEGAKLALFSSLDDDDEIDYHEDVDVDTYNNNNNNNDHGSTAPPGVATISTTTIVDVSPSTDNSRGGGSIDRMILVGESSMVYAWTPEEASSTFTHQEFSDLMERRCDLGLHGDELLPDDDDEEDGEDEVTKLDVDSTSSKSDAKKKKNDHDVDKEDLIIEKTIVPTVEVIDLDLSDEQAAAEEQVVEACSAVNDKTHTKSHTEEAKYTPRVVAGEPKDVTQPPVIKNVLNPYAKKGFSQVTPHRETKSKSPHKGTRSKSPQIENIPKVEEVIKSSVRVQSKETRLSPADAKVLDDVTCEKKDSGQASDDTQNVQRQPADEPEQHIQLDIDDSFDDMLDEDSLDEATTPRKKEGVHKNVLNTNTSTIGGDSFDDMLDEYSLDVVTPHQSKLNSKMDTPGGDSFDDLLGEDSDDNIAAMFQTKNPQTQPTSGNLFSPPKGIAVLDKDDLADLGDEDDDDF